MCSCHLSSCLYLTQNLMSIWYGGSDMVCSNKQMSIWSAKWQSSVAFVIFDRVCNCLYKVVNPSGTQKFCFLVTLLVTPFLSETGLVILQYSGTTIQYVQSFGRVWLQCEWSIKILVSLPFKEIYATNLLIGLLCYNLNHAYPKPLPFSTEGWENQKDQPLNNACSLFAMAAYIHVFITYMYGITYDILRRTCMLTCGKCISWQV